MAPFCWAHSPSLLSSPPWACTYWLGSMPKCFLKSDAKCDEELNPTIEAMADILYLSYLSNSAARLSLYRVKKSPGVCPVRAFIL